MKLGDKAVGATAVMIAAVPREVAWQGTVDVGNGSRRLTVRRLHASSAFRGPCSTEASVDAMHGCLVVEDRYIQVD